MGAFLVIATTAMAVLFLGGVNARMFFLIAAMALGAFALIIAFDDLRRTRILAYLDPWNPAYAQGKAYQLTHSLIAFGRGEIFGVGLGGSVEKLHWLPEAHTDFLLAVIGEEFGFIGVMVVLGLLTWLMLRCIRVAARSTNPFASLVAFGLVSMIFVHVLINVGMTVGVMPITGIPLPFFSYGSTSLLVNLSAIGILLNVSRQAA